MGTRVEMGGRCAPGTWGVDGRIKQDEGRRGRDQPDEMDVMDATDGTDGTDGMD